MEKVTFRIPLSVSIAQAFITILVGFLEFGVIPFFPILIIVGVFVKGLSKEFREIIGFGLIFAMAVYVLVIHDVSKEPITVKLEFFRKAYTYLPRRYIMKNVRCPNCGSRFKGWRKLEVVPIYLDEIALICGNCGKEFAPYPCTDTFFGVYTLKEVRRQVIKVNIDDIYLDKAIYGRGYTLYIKLTIKNRGEHKMWISFPYVITNKKKMHLCLFDRVAEDKDSIEEGSPMEIPPHSTMQVTAKTLDLEKIDQSLSKSEIPVKFFYRLSDDQGIQYPEPSIKMPEELTERLKSSIY
ncbi:MAG TPA: hypothetical protein ENF40_00825 [Thermoplasmatales archaeon]|nr:hypothetical protein [Thermoplasmatales archaeon]